jgi:hypothetical protein
MTAAFCVGSYPVLVGDILLSGLEVLGKQVHIPTIGNIDSVFPEGAGFSIVGLCQKLCIVNDRIAIGWAGRRFSAATVIKHLIVECAKREFTLEDITNFWENDVDKWHKDDLSLVGFIKYGNLINWFGFNFFQFCSQQFGDVYLSGTGVQATHDFLETLVQQEYPSGMNALEKATATALFVSTHMIGNELIRPEVLLNYFGGGAEIVSLVKGKFRKIGEITYVFWYVKENEDQTINFRLPKMALKFTYHEDFLLIRRGTFDESENPFVVKCDDHRVDIVEPIHKSFDISHAKNLSIPSFNSRWTCHFILVEEKNGSFSLRILQRHTGNGDYEFFFVENNGLIENLEMKEQFLRSLYSSVIQ